MNQDPRLRNAIAALGTQLGPDVLRQCMSLYRDLHSAARGPSAADCEYGAHPRQRLDVYAPMSTTKWAKPIFVWVHGGGFSHGEKRSAEHPFNAHIGEFAARRGWMGVVMNYRLAPEFGWPAGGEDVGAVVGWLGKNAAAHGGNVNNIFLAGTSAGAVHVATHLKLRGESHGVRGAILLSGLYGVTPLEAADRSYYGDDQRLYPERFPLDALARSAVPLLIACAEFDPARFHLEWRRLLDELLLSRRGQPPRSHLAAGHNHYTLAMHLGTDDTGLSDQIVQFIAENGG